MVGLEDTNQGFALPQDAAKRIKPDDVVWKPNLLPFFQPNREAMMIKVRYDRKYNTVIVEFEGNIDAEQAKQFFADLEKVHPKPDKDFKLLTDFSLVDAMDFSVKGEIEKAMDLFNAQGVTEIIRVIPDPNMDIGFNIMSASHYSKQIKVHTVRSRQEAEAHLGSEKTD
jgi:anti-anti-sigma regulatory factor